MHNVAAAYWYEAQQRWIVPFHGSGSDEQLALCHCDRCASVLAARNARLAREGEMLRAAPGSKPTHREVPRRIDVAPVRQRLCALLDAGMTHTDIAVAAGINRTTLYRLLRPDVGGVHVDTAAALAAIDVEAWRERVAASSPTTAPERDGAIVRAQRRNAAVYAAGGHFVNGHATVAPRRKRAPGEEPPHGTTARYVWRFDQCRCDDCRVAMNADRAARKRAQRRRLAGAPAAT